METYNLNTAPAINKAAEVIVSKHLSENMDRETVVTAVNMAKNDTSKTVKEPVPVVNEKPTEKSPLTDKIIQVNTSQSESNINNWDFN